jgi:hypothetical protein
MHEGKDLRAKGDHAGALKKFSAAYSVVPTPITGLAVAQEQVALGLLVEARDTLGEVQRMPTKATESADGKAARDEAATLLSDVMARIPIVEVRVTGAPAGSGVTLTIDSRSVPASAAEEGWRVNPGRHTVVASLVGRPDQTSAIELKERDRKKVELVFPAVVSTKPVDPVKPVEPPQPVTPPATKTTLAEAPKESTPAPTPDTPSSGSSTKYIGIAALGTGVVAVGIGGVLGLAARSKYNSAKSDHCDSAGICDAEGKKLTDDARGLGTTGTIVFTVGAVIAVGGAVLWLTAPDGGATKTGVTSVGVGIGSLTVGGRF